MLAASGLLDEHPSAVRDGPAYLRFPLGEWGATWLAATGIVAQLLVRMRGGSPAPVATSLFQGALVPAAMLWHDADTDQASLETGNSKTKRPTLFQCADGVWLHLMHHPDHTPGMQQAFDAMGPEGVEAANDALGPQRKFPNYGANVEAFKTKTSSEWLPELWAADVPAQAAVTMGEAYRDAQAQRCGYAVNVTDSILGETVQPGPPVHVTPPGAVRNPAPQLDVDRENILSQQTGPSAATDAPAAAPTEAASTLPLAGLIVLDFGFFPRWAVDVHAACRSGCRRYQNRTAQRRPDAHQRVGVYGLSAQQTVIGPRPQTRAISRRRRAASTKRRCRAPQLAHARGHALGTGL